MNIPNIEFREKFLTFIGLGLMIASYIAINNIAEKISDYEIEYRKSVIIYNNYNKDFLNWANNQVTKQSTYGSRLEKLSDSISRLQFNQWTIQLDSLRSQINRQNKYYHITYEKKHFVLDSLNKSQSIESDFYNNKLGELNFNRDNYWILLFLGFFLFAVGIITWSRKEESERILIIRQNLDKPTYSENCQSCGKLFNSINTPGKEKDGKNNYHFCKNCYDDGRFIEPDLTIIELENRTKKELDILKFDSRYISKIIKKLNNLDRWKRNMYSK